MQKKNMNIWWGNGVLIQVWDQTQIIPRNLRPPQTTYDHSPTKSRLSHDCDTIQHQPCLGHTHWVSDWSETSADILFLFFSFALWVWDKSGIKPRPPGTKTKPTCHLESQEVSDNLKLCKFRSEILNRLQH